MAPIEPLMTDRYTQTAPRSLNSPLLELLLLLVMIMILLGLTAFPTAVGSTAYYATAWWAVYPGRKG